MTVKRIVSNIAASSVADVQKFYSDLFDLHVVMDHGWIATLASGETASTQVSIATEGGSGTAVPDLSIEVDDVDTVYQKARKLGHHIEYELTDEPWGCGASILATPLENCSIFLPILHRNGFVPVPKPRNFTTVRNDLPRSGLHALTHRY